MEGFDLHFHPMREENYSVAAVESGGKQMSTGHLHLDGFKFLFPTTKKQRRHPVGCLLYLAERVGFEPTVRCRITSFQDWLLKPLGHLSIDAHYTISENKSQGKVFTFWG